MRAAPAFELNVTPGLSVRAVLAMIGGACAAAVCTWAWSHIDAAAGPAGRGAAAWLAVSVGTAMLGGWLGWRLAPRTPYTIAWHQGQWTLCPWAAAPRAGTVQVKLDVGSWMLLCFRPAGAGPTTWLAVSNSDAGPAWHALRATLFAPGAPDPASAGDEGARS